MVAGNEKIIRLFPRGVITARASDRRTWTRCRRLLRAADPGSLTVRRAGATHARLFSIAGAQTSGQHEIGGEAEPAGAQASLPKPRNHLRRADAGAEVPRGARRGRRGESEDG